MSDQLSRAMIFVSKGVLRTDLIPLPSVAPDEAHLALEACGVCGSDLALFAGEKAGAPFPLVAGHEIIARVVAIGDEASRLRQLEVGDRVALEESIPCHSCTRCLSGRHRLCSNAQRYGGTSIENGGALLGGYADHILLPQRAVAHRVPDTLDAALGTLFIPLSNGLSWLSSRANLQPGESVLVLGPGQHGLATVAAARELGAGQIIVAGLASDAIRLEAATELGADVTVIADEESLLERVREVTGGRGVDIVLEATPHATSPVIDAIQACAAGGRVLLAGVKRGRLVNDLPVDQLLFSEISLLGVNARESWAIPAALRLLDAHPERFAALTGPSLELTELGTALELLVGASGPAPVHVSVHP